MTDLEKLKELLCSFGVGFEEILEEGGPTTINCDEGGNKIVGYAGFITIFFFDPNGAFIEMGAWE